MKEQNRTYKKLLSQPHVLPELYIEVYRRELSIDQIKAVNETIQPLFKTPVKSLFI